jgi:hypothetical protein
MFWARPEREQPCVARRYVEQQRQQRAVRQSQQQHAIERQQQHWLSMCEGDSEGVWSSSADIPVCPGGAGIAAWSGARTFLSAGGGGNGANEADKNVCAPDDITLSSGQSARVHGLPQCPERKPTGRGLFPKSCKRGTNKRKGRGLVAGALAAVNVPAPTAVWSEIFNRGLERGHSCPHGHGGKIETNEADKNVCAPD